MNLDEATPLCFRGRSPRRDDIMVGVHKPDKTVKEECSEAAVITSFDSSLRSECTSVVSAIGS